MAPLDVFLLHRTIRSVRGVVELPQFLHSCSQTLAVYQGLDLPHLKDVLKSNGTSQPMNRHLPDSEEYL